MVRSKILDMSDMNKDELFKVNNLFNAHFGNHWPEVPCRQWEYCSAIAYSDVLFTKGKVLDIGCGQSIFPYFLKKIGCEEVYGIDPRIHNRDENGIHFRNGSMTDLNAFEGHFDIVFAMSSIEHVNAGAYAINQRLELGLVALEKTSWHLGFAPEVGFAFGVGEANLLLNARYNYALPATSITGESLGWGYFSFNIGFAWATGYY